MAYVSNKQVNIIYKDLSYKIVGILFDVYNELGYGYLEKIYEKAVKNGFDLEKIKYKQQAAYKITYKDKVVGRCFLDFIVEDKIVLELKKGGYFSKKNIEQVRTYLQTTGMKLAILANFTPHGVKFIRVLNPNNDKAIKKKVY